MAIAFYWDKEGCQVTKVENKEMHTLFSLSNGTTFKIGIPLDKLEQLLQIKLIKKFANVDLSIFLSKFEMTAHQWKTISSTLNQSSEVAEAFEGHPKLQKLLEFSYKKLRELPTLIYGGYSQGLYLSYPLNFIREPRSNFYSNLFWDNGYVVMIRLDLQYKIMEVSSGNLMSHYIRDQDAFATTNCKGHII